MRWVITGYSGITGEWLRYKLFGIGAYEVINTVYTYLGEWESSSGDMLLVLPVDQPTDHVDLAGPASGSSGARSWPQHHA